MKHRTSTPPDFSIVERGGIFKVFDKNQHFRRSFATRQGAQDFIAEQRLGSKRAQPAAQPAPVATTN